MEIDIANGTLSTDHGSASFSNPIFILDGSTHDPNSQIDDARSACDIVAEAYTREADQGRCFSVAEYNMIARFSGLPLANYCSGE